VKQVATDREDVRQLHEATEEVERVFNLKSLGARGSLVTFTWDGAGAIAVAHKLGRVPEGWLLVDLDANTAIYRTADLNATDLELTAGAEAVAKVLVF